MKMKAVLAMAISLACAIPAHAVYDGKKPVPGRPEFAPDRILVKFKSDASPLIAGEVHKGHRAEVRKVIPGINVHVVGIPPGIAVEEMVRRYNAEVSVEYAEPDYIARAAATAVPDDPLFSQQWGLKNANDADIDAPEGWGMKTGSPSIEIAIVDTGIGPHQDLAVVSGYNAITNVEEIARDDNGHGTHVAGIAAAATANGVGVAGVSWGCGLMAVKVLDAEGSGYYSDVADGIMWAANHGAQVINMSLGGSSDSATLRSAVDYAWGKGTLLACAAGNSGSSAPSYPGKYNNCIAVAATDRNDQKTWWSTSGKWVDVAAPGDGILSTYPGDLYLQLSGTSMATPHVAGLAGLVWDATSDANNDGKFNDDVRARIESTCDRIKGTGKYWSKGRINACRALGGTCGYAGPAVK